MRVNDERSTTFRLVNQIRDMARHGSRMPQFGTRKFPHLSRLAEVCPRR